MRRSKPKILRADSAPGQLTLDDYCARPHALVSFAGDLSGFVDGGAGKIRPQAQGGPGGAAVQRPPGTPSLAGTDIIATVPDYAAQALIAAGGLRAEDPPFETRAFRTVDGLARRQDNDPAERWLRSRIQHVHRQSGQSLSPPAATPHEASQRGKSIARRGCAAYSIESTVHNHRLLQKRKTMYHCS